MTVSFALEHTALNAKVERMRHAVGRKEIREMMMKWASIALGVLAAITGLVAAVYWYRSSKVGLTPIWGGLEPVEPLFSQMGWLAGLMQTFAKSADLNKRAALWTAVSVVLAACSNFLGIFSSAH